MLVILLATLLCLAVGAKKPFQPKGDSASDRLSHLQSLAAQAGGKIIELDNASYEYFVIDKPRDYSLIVFFTANDPRYKCVVCPDVDKDLNVVYENYLKSVAREGGSDMETFFVKLDFDRGSDTFIRYEMNSVPVLFHVNHKSGAGDGKSPYSIPVKDRYPFPETTDVHAIAEWVKYKTGVNVKIEKSPLMAYVMTIVCFGGIALLVPRIINSLDTFWLPMAQNKNFWTFISGTIYCCSISGLIYDILRTPPWYYTDRKGGLVLFYPQAQQQFVVEGFIIGLLNIGAAGSLIWTVAKAPKLSTPERRSIGVICGYACFAILFWQVRSLYVMKNPWYGSYM